MAISATRSLVKPKLVLAILIAVVTLAGCVVLQPKVAPPSPETDAQPLPFKGRLGDGDPTELPRSVAMSLSDNSPVSFMYREELTHADHHASMTASAFNPLTYAGYPLGEYTVTAFASLSIVEGEKVLGDYTAHAHLSESYSLYAAPTHKDLDEAARAAARRQIDQDLESDRNRLWKEFANSPSPAIGAAGK